MLSQLSLKFLLAVGWEIWRNNAIITRDKVEPFVLNISSQLLQDLLFPRGTSRVINLIRYKSLFFILSSRIFHDLLYSLKHQKKKKKLKKRILFRYNFEVESFYNTTIFSYSIDNKCKWIAKIFFTKNSMKLIGRLYIFN